MGFADLLKAIMGLDCDDAIVATKENRHGKYPADDADASIVCKTKARSGKEDIECSKDCPKGKR